MKLCRSAYPSGRTLYAHLPLAGLVGGLLALITLVGFPNVAAAQPPQIPASDTKAAGDTVHVEASCPEKHEAMERALNTFASRIENAANSATAEEEGRLPKQPDVSMLLSVNWKTKSLDIPSVTLDMQRRDIVLKTPQVTMKERAISFNVPGTRMENRTLMGKPELVCKQRGFKISCKYRSKPIITKVPVFFTETKKISTKVPEVAMRNTSTAFSVPRATVAMRRVSLKLPEFTSECWQINKPEACNENEIKRMEQTASESQQRLELAIATAQNKAAGEALEPIHAFFECQKKTLLEQHTAMTDVFKTSIAQVEATIKLLNTQGAGATEEAIQLAGQLNELRQEALKQTEALDVALKELSDQEGELLATLNGATEDVTVAVQQ